MCPKFILSMLWSWGPFLRRAADMSWLCIWYQIIQFFFSTSEYIHILLAYMHNLPCSISMLSLFLLLSDNSWDQLMLFVLLYPTLNKSYVMLCLVFGECVASLLKLNEAILANWFQLSGGSVFEDINIFFNTDLCFVSHVTQSSDICIQRSEDVSSD